VPPHLTLFTTLLAAILTRHNQALVEFLLAENQVLRQIAKPHLRTITDPQRRALANAAKATGRRALSAIETTFHPDTLLRWYRQLVAAKYASPRGGRGRPRSVRDRVTHLVVRLARENPSWGYTRLRDALAHLGVDVGRNTIARVLQEHDCNPSPSRKKRVAWATFLKLHWGAIAVADFFTVEVLTARGLVRYLVLIIIDLKTRRIELAGLSHTVDGVWMQQIGRNSSMLLMAFCSRRPSSSSTETHSTPRTFANC
jgi:putative transposase